MSHHRCPIVAIVVFNLYCFNPRSNSFSQSLCLFDVAVVGMRLGECKARGVPLSWIVGVTARVDTVGEVSINHDVDDGDGVELVDLIVLLSLLLSVPIPGLKDDCVPSSGVSLSGFTGAVSLDLACRVGFSSECS